MDEPAPDARLPDLLDAARVGDARATDELLPLLYDELRKLARARMARERPGDSLRPTGLVHEAYLRLIGPEGAATWRNRGHFFAAAAEAMRRVLIERARGRGRAKRGSDPRRTTLATRADSRQTPAGAGKSPTRGTGRAWKTFADAPWITRREGVDRVSPFCRRRLRRRFRYPFRNGRVLLNGVRRRLQPLNKPQSHREHRGSTEAPTQCFLGVLRGSVVMI